MVSQAMLKEIVDETSRGKYDFMYLRIGKSVAAERVSAKIDSGYLDFANNCK